jgi:uncharacterized protein DUF6370
MKSAPVVLALWLIAASAVAAEPAGSAGAPAKAPVAKMKATAVRDAATPKGGVAAPVTLQGDLTCAKCGLHEAASCQSVLVVKEDGRDIKYYLNKNAVAAAEHEKVCGGSVPATVTGTVREEGGRKMLTASTVSTGAPSKGDAGAALPPHHGHE